MIGSTINSSEFYIQHLQILRWFTLIGNGMISIAFNIILHIAITAFISLRKMLWKDPLFDLNGCINCWIFVSISSDATSTATQRRAMSKINDIITKTTHKKKKQERHLKNRILNTQCGDKYCTLICFFLFCFVLFLGCFGVFFCFLFLFFLSLTQQLKTIRNTRPARNNHLQAFYGIVLVV